MSQFNTFLVLIIYGQYVIQYCNIVSATPQNSTLYSIYIGTRYVCTYQLGKTTYCLFIKQ